MGTETKYNGWTNYETWNASLWMDNSEGDQSMWAERAQEAYDSATAERGFTREERATLDLSHSLKEEYENAMADMLETAGQSSGMWADLLGAALSEVNWHEIAEHMIENVDKETEQVDE